MADETQQMKEEAKTSSNVAEMLAENTTDINLAAIADIPVEITAVLGCAKMPVSQLLKLGRGAVVKLDRKVGEAIDIYVNDRLIARGEVVLVENRIGVTMTEILKPNVDKD